MLEQQQQKKKNSWQRKSIVKEWCLKCKQFYFDGNENLHFIGYDSIHATCIIVSIIVYCIMDLYPEILLHRVSVKMVNKLFIKKNV